MSANRLLILFASVLTTACNHADGLVVVTVDANPQLIGVTALHVTATAGTRPVEFDVLPTGGAPSMDIPPERSFAIVVPPDLGETLSVRVEARRGADVLGSMTGTAPVEGGSRTDVRITIGVQPPENDGGTDGGAIDMSMDAALPPDVPTLISPLSTSFVTSKRPTLRWKLPTGSGSPEVDLCKDRACTTMIGSATVTGSTATPTADLAKGVVFWRVRASSAGITKTSATWEFFAGARTATGGTDASFGTVSDFNGDGLADVVAGAPNTTVGGIMAVGRVHIFQGATSGLPDTPVSIDGRDGQSSLFGQSVASAGDVNGDGFADLAVGVPISNSSSPGRVYIFFGSATGVNTSAPQVIDGPNGGGAFGISVASAGDVNGDGFADLVVGANQATVNSATFAGRVFVFYGSSSGLQTAAGTFTMIDGADGANAMFGSSVAGGDMNGDGFADVLAGAPAAVIAGNPTGKAYVFKGDASGVVTTTPFRVFAGPDGANQSFGGSVALAGDVNGDGIPDVAIGEPNYAAGGVTNVGRVYVYLASTGGFVTSPAILDSSFGMDGYFGFSVASGGDLDGDGFSDLVVGAWKVKVSTNNSVGAISVFRGSANGIVTATPTMINGYDAPGFFGWTVGSGGDTTGDGYSDVVVGSIAASNFAGRAFVFEGSASGIKTTFTKSWTGPDANGQFGTSVY